MNGISDDDTSQRSPRRYLGIDPGKTGAWALLDENGKYLEGCLGGVPEQSFILRLAPDVMPIIACLESVHAMPGQGACSMFSFGESFGMIKGILRTLQIPYELVTPGKWQKSVLDTIPRKEAPVPDEDAKAEGRRRAANKKTLKNAITAYVVRRWPELSDILSLVKNQGLADAVCLAEYIRRKDS